jgi:hypothetical protein
VCVCVCGWGLGGGVFLMGLVVVGVFLINIKGLGLRGLLRGL